MTIYLIIEKILLLIHYVLSSFIVKATGPLVTYLLKIRVVLEIQIKHEKCAIFYFQNTQLDFFTSKYNPRKITLNY